MINVFRLHQKKLMLVITILTILAFIWLYNPANMKEMGDQESFMVYGKRVSLTDLRREANKFFLARDLGQTELIRDLSGNAPNENQMVDDFVWNLLVIQHEAAQLGVEPTTDQIAARIKTLPIFQTNGQFDFAKYQAFASEKLGPRGFTEVQLEGVIKDALRLESLRAVVSSPVAVSQAEIAQAGRVMQKVDVQTVSFSGEEAFKATQVSEEEIKGYFTQMQSSPYMVVPETRAVEFVEFALPADVQPATGGGKNVEALQKLADAAVAFAAKASTDFAKAASEAGLKVTATPAFDRSGSSRETTENLPSLSGLAPSVFLLSDQAPVSDPIQVGEKFYVVRLATINPQRAMTFDEAKPLIEMRLRSQKAEDVLRQSAEAAVVRIREAMAGGKSFSDAAAALGLKVETINGVSPTASAPDQRAIMATTLMMSPGQLSGFVPGTQGGFAVHLVARAPLDAAESAKQAAELGPEILGGKRNLLFVTWLSSAREGAAIGRVTPRQ